jgi:hypothetical protein
MPTPVNVESLTMFHLLKMDVEGELAPQHSRGSLSFLQEKKPGSAKPIRRMIVLVFILSVSRLSN